MTALPTSRESVQTLPLRSRSQTRRPRHRPWVFPLFRYLGGAFAKDLPLPLGNVIGGGAHAENATEIQEFLVVPGGAADTEEAVFANAAVHRHVKELLKKKGKSCGKGDEGAWAPQIDDALAFESLPRRPDLSLMK